MQLVSKKYFFCIFLLFLFAFQGISQQVPADTTGKKLQIIEADRYNFQKIDSVGDFISLAGKVRIKQGNTYFNCDSAVLNQVENSIEAFGNIHINDADSIHTYSQYLKYLGQEKRALLKNKVRLTDGKAVLTTNELEYNTQTHIGTYTNGGKVVNGKTVLTSNEGIYFGDTKDVIFRKKVTLTDPEYKVTTDTLLYNASSEIAKFNTYTKIINKERTIETREGFYDLKNKKASFGKRPIVNDKDYSITADQMAMDDATGFGEANGNVVYKSKDTVNAFAILANNLKTNQKTGSVMATQKPLMIIQQGKDSIYLTADTLYSAKLTELKKSRTVPDLFEPSTDSSTIVIAEKKVTSDSSTNRFFEAYYNVKIFTDSMQAISDSMFYSFSDSVFRLFKNPVIWTQENQVTGDTIYLFTSNKKPARFSVFENAVAISKVAKDFYNQVKGNFITGYFTDGNINFIKAKGGAENIYFAADESGAFIGLNRSTSDVIDVYFEDRKPEKVILRNNLEGTIYPIRQANPSELQVRGFKWLEDKRPKSKFELFGN